jgi:hypothetical protein
MHSGSRLIATFPQSFPHLDKTFVEMIGSAAAQRPPRREKQQREMETGKNISPARLESASVDVDVADSALACENEKSRVI